MSEPVDIVLLGNTAVVEKFRERGENRLRRRARPDLRNRITTVGVPQSWTTVEKVIEIARMWPWQSDADGPEWVESSNAVLAALVAEHFTTDTHECVVGRPEGWVEG